MPFVVIQTAAVNAHGALTVVEYGGIQPDAEIHIGGLTIKNGQEWFAAENPAATAASIKSALDPLAGSSFTSAVEGNVVTVTSTTAGAAGNGQLIFTTDIDPANVVIDNFGGNDTLGGGVDASAAGRIGNGRVRISALLVTSDSTGGAAQVFSGSDDTGAEYDLITGTASKTVLRTYKGGLVLGNAYVSGDAHITKIVAQFTAF